MRATGADTAWLVRPMAAGDLAAACALAQRVAEAAGWSPGDYERAVRGDWDAWVAVRESPPGSHLLGFLIARRMADEMEILNLAVAPTHRRRGVGRRLLEAAVDLGRARDAKQVFLEVRVSNAAAIAFYQRQGFVRSARRPHYYAQPAEDAWVLSRNLDARPVGKHLARALRTC